MLLLMMRGALSYRDLQHVTTLTHINRLKHFVYVVTFVEHVCHGITA